MNPFLQIVIVCPDSALRKYQEFSRNASLLTRNSQVFVYLIINTAVARLAVGRPAGTCLTQPAVHPRMDTGRSSGRHQARQYTVLRQSRICKLYGVTAKAGAPAHGKI